MPKPNKIHIRHPANGKLSMCMRKSVKQADELSGVTCESCLTKIADGQYERAQFARNSSAEDGRNETGQPRFTEMQRAFAAHPAVTTNPQTAAIDAGYSRAYAKSHAIKLRKQMTPLIIQLQEKAKKLSAISVAKVQTELASMGFANVIDYFDIDESGRMMPKKLNELTREQAAAIQEVKLVEYETLDGENSIRIGWLKLADKRANLVELGKTLGMFNKIVIEDKREQTLLMNDIPTEALEEAENLLLAAAAIAKDNKANAAAIPGEFKEITHATTQE